MMQKKSENEFPSSNAERLAIWKAKLKMKEKNSFATFPLNYYAFKEAK